MIEIAPSTFLDIDRLTKKFGQLTLRMVDIGTEAAGKYILLAIKKDVPGYRYVSRKAAYGKTFFSDKQRRWFFKNRMWEKIPYQRTHVLENSWEMIGSGANLTIRNQDPAAEWAYSEGQARQLEMVGWRRVSTTMEVKERNAAAAAERAIAKEIERTIGGGRNGSKKGYTKRRKKVLVYFWRDNET